MQFVDMYVCMRGYLHTYALEGVQTSAFNDCPGVSGQTGSLGWFFASLQLNRADTETNRPLA